MKRNVLINLICAVIATMVVIVGIILGMILTDKMDVEKRTLVISSASSAATYNGEALSDSKWYLTEGELKSGHSLSVSVTGSQKTVGISENYVTAKVFNAQGVDVSADYNIEYLPGILNVKARDICIIAESAEKFLDDEPLTCDGYYLESDIALLPDDTLEVTVEGSMSETGIAPNKVTSVVITNEKGVDVSRNYHITTKDGTLMVYDENTLIIESASDSKVFDGTELKNHNYRIYIKTGKEPPKDEQLAELKDGHELKIEFSGSQLLIGSSENTFVAQITDEQGNDVTETYNVIYKTGTLVVSRPKVDISDIDGDWDTPEN